MAPDPKPAVAGVPYPEALREIPDPTKPILPLPDFEALRRTALSLERATESLYRVETVVSAASLDAQLSRVSFGTYFVAIWKAFLAFGLVVLLLAGVLLAANFLACGAVLKLGDLVGG